MRESVQFLYEVGNLKNVSRSGWWLFGNKNPESVAEHTFRCAVIGYLLARSENIDAFKVIMMCLFHDLHEARINDLHKIAKDYIDTEASVSKILQEQLESLKESEKKEIKGVLEELSDQESMESIVARDADILECAMQAREYHVQGYEAAADWIERAKDNLRSESSRKMLSIIEHSDPNEWWKKLKDRK